MIVCRRRSKLRSTVRNEVAEKCLTGAPERRRDCRPRERSRRRLSLRLQVTKRLRNSIRPSYRLMGFMEAETDEALDLTPA